MVAGCGVVGVLLALGALWLGTCVSAVCDVCGVGVGVYIVWSSQCALHAVDNRVFALIKQAALRLFRA